MGSKAPKQQALTLEKQSRYEEDVKEIERCGPYRYSYSFTFLCIIFFVFRSFCKFRRLF